MSILAMTIVDSWKVWSQITTTAALGATDIKPEELINNRYDQPQTRRGATTTGNILQNSNRTNNAVHPVSLVPRSGTGLHLTPTKRKRNNATGYTLQL